MITPATTVHTADELARAVRDASRCRITVGGSIEDVPPLRLAPGQALFGEDGRARIAFQAGADGVMLTSDNEIRGLELLTSPDRRAILNDTMAAGLGCLRLADLVVTGQVQILARDAVRSGHVEVDGLHIAAADARARPERPQGYGVRVVQGAFTLWNMQEDASVTITADLAGLSAGRLDAPVLGSGIFVGGAGDVGGRLLATRLETGAIYSDARIAPGTADLISGGVFAVHGAHVDFVRNHGPVTTFGPNDMVLDNWGLVDRWIAKAKIRSYGPSGIGFVNFGTVNELKVEAPIETFGRGARGFNVYTGTVRSAEFDRIVTRGDGAVGIQISQPVGRLVVRRGTETFGATGDSLVKGVVVKLSAVGLSIKPGGVANEIDIEGGVTAHGDGIAPIEMHGQVGALRIRGGINAAVPGT